MQRGSIRLRTANSYRCEIYELRALHDELLHQQNQQETEPQNYNNYAREVCQLGLDFVALIT